MVAPFLVTPEICDHPPILPIKATTLLTETLRHHLFSLVFKQALPDRSHTVKTQLVNFTKAERERDPSISLVKTTMQKIVIPANNKVSVDVA